MDKGPLPYLQFKILTYTPQTNKQKTHDDCLPRDEGYGNTRIVNGGEGK